jgi:hypothetical protein
MIVIFINVSKSFLKGGTPNKIDIKNHTDIFSNGRIVPETASPRKTLIPI